MSRGRIIVVTLSEPFPFGQANGRWCHALLKGLAERRYEVRCLSVTTNPQWARGAEDLLAPHGVTFSCYPLVETGRGSWPARTWRTISEPFSYPISGALRRDLRTELKRGYDVLHLEQLWSGYLAEYGPRSLVSLHHLALLDLKGVWRASWPFLVSKALLARAERRLLRRLRCIRTTTTRLADTAALLNPKAAIHTVPIALDPSLVKFSDEDRTPEPVIGFVGSMNWSPGYLAAARLITRVLPAVRARRPDARVLLVGWNARQMLGPLSALPNVQVIANVPDARPYFDQLQVFVYPLPQGSGMKVKILEAMAYGVPVVTTAEGIEGIAAEDGVHAFIADDDAVLAERIVQLLQHPALRRRLRRNARRLVEECYSPGPTVAALERVYDAL